MKSGVLKIFENAGMGVAIFALFSAHGSLSEEKKDTPPPNNVNFSIYENSPLTKTNYYTSRVLKFVQNWPPATLDLHDDRPVYIRGIKTPDNSDIVGMVKHFTVKASFDSVINFTENFTEYPKIWEDVQSVKIQSQDHNRIVTEWVRKAPAFFLSKIRYTLLYTSDKTLPGRVVYRQQLVESNSIKANDAIVVMEKMTEETTRVSVVTFFEAEFGPFRSLIESKIWRKSLESSFKDDIAFMSKLEHPDWTLDQISDAADLALKKNPLEQLEYTDLLKF